MDRVGPQEELAPQDSASAAALPGEPEDVDGLVGDRYSSEGTHLRSREGTHSTRVAAHLGSAWRLRVALCAEAPSSDAKTESVFDSRARLLHAEGETQGRRERELLLDAVKRIRQSEGIERARPEEALLRAATPGLLDVWAERVLTATSLDDVLR